MDRKIIARPRKPLQPYVELKVESEAKERQKNDLEVEERRVALEGEDRVLETPEERGLGMRYLTWQR